MPFRDPQRQAREAGYAFGKTPLHETKSEANAAVHDPGRLESYFDQNLTGPGLWKWRHYFPIYERHLQRFVGESPTVVEIGIYSGGSLLMWHEYFGPGAMLHGVDIEEACRAYETEATRIHIGDQADPAFWRAFNRHVPPPDVVLDDGGHEPHQQIATLQALLPRLAPGGVYLCEDIYSDTHGFHEYVSGLARNLNGGHGTKFPANHLQAAVESITFYPMVVVIEKRRIPLVELEAPKHGTEWQPFYDEDAES